jgi:hypothetical protein
VNWYHLIYIVPAIFSGTTMLGYLSPVKVSARFLPLLTFLVALLAIVLPMKIDVALAVVPAVAMLHRFFRIDLTAHQPVSVTQALRIGKGLQDGITEFAAKAYPRPEDDVDTHVAAPDDDKEVARDEVPVVKSATKPQVTSFIPDL